MIVREYQDYTLSRRGKQVLVLICDTCGEQHQRSGNHAKISLHREFHYCSKACTARSRHSQRKRKETCVERYGVPHPLQAESVMLKVKDTCVERYGVDNPWKAEEIQQKRRETWIEMWGIDNPAKVLEHQQKCRETTLENHGVECGWLIPSVQAKMNSPAARKKAQQTLTRNGTHGKSKIEDRFYAFLLDLLPNATIERHVRINGWCIDFKVNDFYIQFDGTYWHGLNRPLTEIQMSDKPRDAVILKTYYRDKEQIAWFKQQNLRLLRVTDITFKKHPNRVAEDVKSILDTGKIGSVGTDR